MPSGKTHAQLTIQTATLLVPTTLIAALSHSPIVCSVTRAAYIGLPLLLFGFLAGVQPGAIAYLLQAHPREVLGAAIGLEVASLVHIISDWIWSELP